MLWLAVSLVLFVPATAACLRYLVPTIIGLWSRGEGGRAEAPPCSFGILIPAHDEEATLPHALRSLANLEYPIDRITVLVIADNCTDRTAEVARAAGVNCVVRVDPDQRGKGHAIAFGLEHLLQTAPDVVIILDADCELNPTALRHLSAAFAAGAEVVQAAVRFGNPDASTGAYVAAVGAALDDAVSAGRDRLGLGVPLRGMGMAFRSDVLAAHPWTAFGVAEDAEYDRQLRQAGIRVRFCRDAVVTTAAPGRLDVLCRQRQRWRVALRFERWMTSKPLVLLQLAASIVAGLAVGFVIWPLTLAVLTMGVYLRAAAEVGLANRLGLLVRSPVVITRLAWLALVGWFRSDPAEWNRTPRAEPRAI